MQRFLLYAVTLGTLCAQSVQTWGGLSFGMTVTQVRAVLKSRMREAEPKDQTYVVHEFGVRGFEGDVTLLFDKTSKKLTVVQVLLAPLKGSTDQDKSFAYEQMRDDLLKKYGSPVERAGCDNDASESATCHLIFKTGGQSIDARISVTYGVPEVAFVVYEPSGAIKGL